MDSNSTSAQDLANQAIQAATKGDWHTAITLNQQIITRNPQDTATLNRLGRAYTATGQLDHARSTYQQVLNQDPLNSIAQKNLEKLNLLKQTKEPQSDPSLHKTVADQELFIKRPGVTKLVTLVNLGAAEVLAALSCGDLIDLHFSKRTVAAHDHMHRHIGRLPDDMAFRLNQLFKLGYQFSACIKEANATKVQVMIQETSRQTN